MNEAAFFQPGNYFKRPAGDGLYPLLKEPRAVAVTQGACANHARPLDGVALHGAMKAAQDFERLRHGLRFKIAVAKDAFAQARDFTVLVQGHQPAATKFGDAEPHRVGTDINRGKDRHSLSGRPSKGLEGPGRARRLSAGRRNQSKEVLDGPSSR